MDKIRHQTGFTLVEIAIVVLIVSILLGYTVAMVPVQQELKQYRQVERDLDKIVEHIIGFAQVNGRLPCPDTTGDVNGEGVGVADGAEDTDDWLNNLTGAALPGGDGDQDSCKSFYGWLPTRTLGITGNIDANNGTMLDPWGQPYRYHVADVDAGNAFGSDLVTPGNMRAEGVANLTGNLSVCANSNNPSAADADCTVLAGGPAILVDNAMVVIYSSGKDQAGAAFASNIQNENRDGFHNGQNDLVYTFTTRSDVDNNEYDDKIRWISPNVLISRMIQAEQLP